MKTCTEITCPKKPVMPDNYEQAGWVVGTDALGQERITCPNCLERILELRREYIQERKEIERNEDDGCE